MAVDFAMSQIIGTLDLVNQNGDQPLVGRYH